MFVPLFFSLVPLLPLTLAQRPGTLIPEAHPSLLWSRCTAFDNTTTPLSNCTPISASLVLDASLRWIHHYASPKNCYSTVASADYAEWDRQLCNTEANCTANCVIEGSDASSYRGTYGVATSGKLVSMRLKNCENFGCNYGSRLFLLEGGEEKARATEKEEEVSEEKYQTFVLLGNEFTFDVDLSTVGCGVNSALYFVAMDADGGREKFPANTAGAAYGTGYCDAQCPMDGKFVGGKANSDGWRPNWEDPNLSGKGHYGSCCSELAIWDSNAHSYSMSSHTCPHNDFQICNGAWDCGIALSNPMDLRYTPRCDPEGCSYNPTRMGTPDFYGKGKTVDTSRNFTVITRFEEGRVYQIFIQDGKRIDTPVPEWEGFSKQTGLSPDICAQQPKVFGEFDRFTQNGGWKTHKDILTRPMVLTMAIDTDHYAYNLWLDGAAYPPEAEGTTGSVRGDCLLEESDPKTVLANNGRAKVTWSNIKFGPIGSTVAV